MSWLCWALWLSGQSSPPSACFRSWVNRCVHGVTVVAAELRRSWVFFRRGCWTGFDSKRLLNLSYDSCLANEHDEEEETAKKVVAADDPEECLGESVPAGDWVDHLYSIVQMASIAQMWLRKVLNTLAEPGQAKDHKEFRVNNLNKYVSLDDISVFPTNWSRASLLILIFANTEEFPSSVRPLRLFPALFFQMWTMQ